MASVRGLLVLVVAALTVGACGVGMMGAGPASASCGNLPGGACNEQLERIGARYPGAREIHVECGPVPCTRAAGAGTARITRADGSTVDEAWTYVGDPGPVPPPTCTAIALDLCRSVATSAVGDLAPARRVLAVDVRCRVGACNDATGEVEVRFAFADGTRESTTMGWTGGPP